MVWEDPFYQVSSGKIFLKDVSVTFLGPSSPSLSMLHHSGVYAMKLVGRIFPFYVQECELPVMNGLSFNYQDRRFCHEP